MRVLRESLAILGLAVAIGSVWLSWSQLPPRIPTHFGFSGPPNGFGPKTSLLELPRNCDSALFCSDSAQSLPSSFQLSGQGDRGELRPFALLGRSSGGLVESRTCVDLCLANADDGAGRAGSKLRAQRRFSTREPWCGRCDRYPFLDTHAQAGLTPLGEGQPAVLHNLSSRGRPW